MAFREKEEDKSCVKLTVRALIALADAIPPARAGLASVAPNGTDGSSAFVKQNAFAPSQGPFPSSSYVTQTPAPGNPPLNDVWESRNA
ncbi:hypothetical protein C5167_026884, partial [Papaver somniferum]